MNVIIRLVYEATMSLVREHDSPKATFAYRELMGIAGNWWELVSPGLTISAKEKSPKCKSFGTFLPGTYDKCQGN